ncbi:MAG: hypothetical protein ACK6DN_02285, partial [Planctomycetota bacterium]
AIGIRPPQAIVKIPDQPQRRAGQRRRAAEQVPLGVVAQRAGRAARGQPGQLMRRRVTVTEYL